MYTLNDDQYKAVRGASKTSFLSCLQSSLALSNSLCPSFLLCYTDYKLNYKCSPNPFCSTYMSESCLSYFIFKLFCIEMS